MDVESKKSEDNKTQPNIQDTGAPGQTGTATTTQSTQPTQVATSSTTINSDGSGENRKKRKRSRWDQAGSSKVKDAPVLTGGISLADLNTLQPTTTTTTQTMIPGVTANNDNSVSSKSGGDSSNNNNNKSTSTTPSAINSDKRKFVKYSDTYKPGMVRVGSKWVYPEDEITDGGTWEHKKRAEEMKQTAGK